MNEPVIIGDATLYLGDCREVLRAIADASVDSICTDPPYELGFMGKKWDGLGIAHNVEMWAECLRVLKPGGHLLAFSGTRTQHRMVCAIEDAGFEIRDQIMWVYGSGFPKSADVSKHIDKAAGAEREVVGKLERQGATRGTGGRYDWNAEGEAQTKDDVLITAPATDAARQWQGWGTALKPAHEPIVVARKPLIGTVAANVLAHGTGALNIDACRVHADDAQGGEYTVKRFAPGASVVKDGNWKQEVEFRGEMKVGRWPANVIHDGSPEVLEAFPDAPGRMADAKLSGERKTANVHGVMRYAEPSADRTYEGSGSTNFAMKPGARRLDTGSAARFFYAAKSSRSDRNEGCEGLLTWASEDLNQLTDVLGQLQKATFDVMTLLQSDIVWSTTSYGSDTTDRYRLAVTSIISTMTGQTTSSETSSYSLDSSTSASIRGAISIAQGHGLSLADCAEFISQSQLSTTGEKTASVLGVVHAVLRTLSDASKSAKQGNVHSTVKPTDLMAYLFRLVTPAGGVVLDPFMGSGSTGKAAMREGFRFIGIDMTPEYVEIARQRIQYEIDTAEAARIEASRQADMFAEHQ